MAENIYVRKGGWIREKIFMGLSFGQYLKKLITPFNFLASIIILAGAYLAVIRFSQGLGSVTNLTNDYPWGLWIGFDVLCGVALAAGGFIIASAIHLFGLKDYRPILRPAILTGFLGYFFVVIGLIFDLGRPWALPFPMFVSYGVASVMFLVAWHVALYLTVQFIEFSPAIFEWLGWKRLRSFVGKLMVGACIAGVILSMLHQSALGALFLLAPGKIHPLWYSPLIPLLFFVSAVIAGLSMIIFESMLSHRIFSNQVDHSDTSKLNNLTLGLGKAAAVALICYFGLKCIGVAHGKNWDLLNTPYGHWFLAEMFGFVLLPCFLFAIGVRIKSVGLVRFTAVLAILGVILNRLNVSIITFRWDYVQRYIPKWSEFVITIAIVTTGLLTFRWIVNRMPVLRKHPEYQDSSI